MNSRFSYEKHITRGNMEITLNPSQPVTADDDGKPRKPRSPRQQSREERLAAVRAARAALRCMLPGETR